MAVVLGVLAGDGLCRAQACGNGAIAAIQGGGVSHQRDVVGAQPIMIEPDPSETSLAAAVWNGTNVWRFGESLQTQEGASVVVLFETCGVTVRVGGNTRVTLERERSDVALYLRLERGEVQVFTPPASIDWLLLSLQNRSYILLRGGALSCSESRDPVLWAGEGAVVRKPVTDELVVREGKPVGEPDLHLTPDEKGRIAIGYERRRGLASLAGAQSNRWVTDAEQGDLIPAWTQAEGGQPTLSGPGRPLAFDQPRTTVASVSAGFGIRATGASSTQPRSVVEQLYENRSISSFAVAQQVERTRVLGLRTLDVVEFSRSGGGLRTNPLVRSILLNTGP